MTDSRGLQNGVAMETCVENSDSYPMKHNSSFLYLCVCVFYTYILMGNLTDQPTKCLKY